MQKYKLQLQHWLFIDRNTEHCRKTWEYLLLIDWSTLSWMSRGKVLLQQTHDQLHLILFNPGN
jgi:hypothetical protein